MPVVPRVSEAMVCLVLASAPSASAKVSSPCLVSPPRLMVCMWPYFNIVKLAVLHSSCLESSGLPATSAATKHPISQLKHPLVLPPSRGQHLTAPTSTAGHSPMHCLVHLGIATLIACQPQPKRAIRGTRQQWEGWDPPPSHDAHLASREAPNDTNDDPAASPVFHEPAASDACAGISADPHVSMPQLASRVVAYPSQTCTAVAAAAVQVGDCGRFSTLPNSSEQSPASNSSQHQTFPVFVKTPKTLVIHARRTDTATDILSKIQDKEGILFDRLQFGGARIPLEKTLADLGVVRDATLHAFVDLKGGGSFFLSRAEDSGDGSPGQQSSPPRVQASPPMRTICCGTAGCTNPTPYRCGTCQLQRYCSREHQVLDGSRHEGECRAGVCNSDGSINATSHNNMQQWMPSQRPDRGWAYAEDAANPAAPLAAFTPAAPNGCDDPSHLRLEDEDGPLTRLPSPVVAAGLWRPVTHADLPFIVGRHVRLRTQPVVNGVVIDRGDDRFYRLHIGGHGWHFAGDLDVYVPHNGSDPSALVAARAEHDGCKDPASIHRVD